MRHKRNDKLVKGTHSSMITVLLTALIIFVITTTIVQAAAPAEEWTKTFGGSWYDGAYSVQQTSDGGYIVAGSTMPYDSDSTDVYLIKTDSSGNLQWTKTFGGTSWDDANSVQQTLDGGYIVVGSTESYGAGDQDIWLIKVDGNGNQQWAKTFGGADFDWAYSVQRTSDGGYILIGSSLIKVDSNGNQQWEQAIFGNSVQQTSDGGYIIASTWYSDDLVTDVYLIKTDSSGNQQWTKTFGGTYDEEANAIQQTSDGGYIVAGSTSSYGAGGTDQHGNACSDVYLIKTDSIGNQQWTKTFGGTSWDGASSVVQTSDGGYIISGYTDSDIAGEQDAWLIKVDSSGNQQWNTKFGGLGYEWANSVVQTSDGGYIIAGDTTSYGAGGSDVWLIKIGAENSIVPSNGDSIGVYDESTGQWAVGKDPATAKVFGFGWTGTEPIVGDWNGDGTDEVGVYNPSGNNFIIQNGANYNVIGLGWSGVIPVIADWNGDGTDEVGVYDPATGQWAIGNDPATAIVFGFGWTGTEPIVGDWNGDGTDEVGTYNPSGNNFIIQNGANYNVIGLGWSGVIPVVGDWNGDRIDEVGVYDPATGQWAVGNDPSTVRVFGFGWAGTEPVVGDWNGDGTDEVGVYNPSGNNFIIQNGANYNVIGLGWSGVIPVAGDWNIGQSTPTPIDQAPVLTTIGDKSISEGLQLSFVVSATDPDGDKVTYSATGLPTGASLDATTGRFTWTPGSGTAGKYTVTFIATANGQTDSETITITVNTVNEAPILAVIGDKSVNEGSQLSFTISATDPNGDKVTYSATGLPTGASLDANTGKFTWTPASGTAGTYTVTFIATANGQTDSETITITVADVVQYKYVTGDITNLMDYPIEVVWKEVGSNKEVFAVDIPAKATVTVKLPIGTFERYVNGLKVAGTITIKSGDKPNLEYWIETAYR